MLLWNPLEHSGYVTLRELPIGDKEMALRALVDPRYGLTPWISPDIALEAQKKCQGSHCAPQHHGPHDSTTFLNLRVKPIGLEAEYNQVWLWSFWNTTWELGP